MAEITLKDGDFGGGVTVTVGETALYLPDRVRPGLNEAVPVTAIAEIESLSNDHSGQLKEAARLSIKGFMSTGNPLGLAAGVLAVRKVKDVEFSVKLNDGRSFVAVADAATLANLKAAARPAVIRDDEEAEAAARADAVIAKYLGADGPPLEPDMPTDAGDAIPLEPEEPEFPAEARPAEPARPRAAAPARPVFGRRRR